MRNAEGYMLTPFPLQGSNEGVLCILTTTSWPMLMHLWFRPLKAMLEIRAE